MFKQAYLILFYVEISYSTYIRFILQIYVNFASKYSLDSQSQQ